MHPLARKLMEDEMQRCRKQVANRTAELRELRATVKHCITSLREHRSMAEWCELQLRVAECEAAAPDLLLNGVNTDDIPF